MKIEIWSDVICSFCYIGKRKFENALAAFEHKDEVQVEWKSFQLDRFLKTESETNAYEYLAKKRGWPPEYTQQLNRQVEAMAAEAGLTYNLKNVIIANSFMAHRFSCLAQKHGLKNEAEEALFKAYFTDGKNIDDKKALVGLSKSISLDEVLINEVLSGTEFTEEVNADISEANRLGITGVPYFLIDRKYIISGAQPEAIFLNTLKMAYQNERLIAVEETSASCNVDNKNC